MVAMLRLVADPTAGAAAMRVLTGPRWRLGGRDIAALWRRAVELDDVGGRGIAHRPTRSSRRPPPTPTPHAWPTRSAIPGRRTPTPPEGHRRIIALGHELTGAARASRSSAARAGRRGAAGARCRRRGPRGPAAVGGLERHRTPRRVRRRGGRLSRRRGPARRCRICWPTWTPPMVVENGLAPAEVDRRARPGADPHRARGQGPGVAGGGGAAPERPGVPVDGVDADLAHRRGRSAAAAARRPRHRRRPRRPGARHVRRQRSESGCPTRSPSTSAVSTSAASTRSAGCCTWRSPAPRTRCCCPATTGAPPKPSRAARRSSSASSRTIIDDSAGRGRAVRRGRALGARAGRR